MVLRSIEIPAPRDFVTFKYELIAEISYQIDDRVAMTAMIDVYAIEKAESFTKLTRSLQEENQIEGKPIVFMHVEDNPSYLTYRKFTWAAYRLVNWAGV